MQHCDPDVLALRALGEQAGTVDDDSHVAGCARCSAELDQLRAVVATARTVRPADAEGAPSPRLWDRIAAELGLGARPVPVAGGSARSSRGAHRARRLAAPLAAAAAAGALVGSLATVALRDGGGERTNDTPAVALARADLGPLEDSGASGTAQVVQSGDSRQLRIRLSGLGRPEGFYEVWLLDKAAKRLLSVGVLSARADGTFTLPAGLDIGAYPVVDVSVEPFDGNPEHSHRSVARGVLPT